MSDYDNFLIRKVFHNDDEVDLSFLIEGVVVEAIDLSGPRIMLKFNDQFSLLRDELRVEPGSILQIAVPMGGYFSDEFDDLLAYEDYRVLTMPVTAKGEVIVNCMHNDIWGWKQPIVQPRIFQNRDPVEIIKDWEPAHNRWDYVYDDGYNQGNSFPVTEDYHFLPGERVTLTIRQMAREHAACFYLTRGERFHCKAKKRMVQAEPLFTYDYYDETTAMDVEFGPYHQPMIIYATPNNNTLLEDTMVRYYTGFDMINGPFWADRNKDKPEQFVSQTHLTTLNNLNTVLVPAVEFTAVGNSWLVAGLTMKLNWYQSDKEAPIDESLPPKALVHTVAHYYSAQKYFMRVKLVNLAEWCEA